MKDIFITSTLHTNWNMEFNPKLCAALESSKISCHLPQRDTDQSESPENIAQQNLDGIKNSELLLCVAENETPNWGVEVTYAYCHNKKIIALMKRGHELPLMVSAMITETIEVDDPENIGDYLSNLKQIIQQLLR
ncbi:MAG: hypothetical protein Q8P20_08545 [bacterium]|nr:hypothetical protein [bacterium]